MDRLIFNEQSPGTLREITMLGKKDWAFLPHPLPLEWSIPEELWPLLTEAHAELARLDGVGRYMPNYNLLLRPLQRREALRSSSLEGTYASPEQLLLFEIDPREPTSVNDPVSSWQEVRNYNLALELGLSLLKEKPLSLNLIRSIHEALLNGVRGMKKDPGNFRRSQVHVGSDRRFIPPPPHELMSCLDSLEKFIHQQKNIDPLLACFMVHYQFEAIHPFLDGNGRVGRLLLSLMIYQQCNLSKPWLYLSSFFDKYKEEYINLLFKVSTQGLWKDWLAFCLRGTIDQSKDTLHRFDKLIDLRNEYISLLKQARGKIRLNQLIDHLFESPAISIPQWSDMSSISYKTAKKDLQILVDSQILSQSNIQVRPKIYFASKILDIAYGDLPF